MTFQLIAVQLPSHVGFPSTALANLFLANQLSLTGVIPSSSVATFRG
jgi:hypothetical protein